MKLLSFNKISIKSVLIQRASSWYWMWFSLLCKQTVNPQKHSFRRMCMYTPCYCHRRNDNFFRIHIFSDFACFCTKHRQEIYINRLQNNYQKFGSPRLLKIAKSCWNSLIPKSYTDMWIQKCVVRPHGQIQETLILNFYTDMWIRICVVRLRG